MDWYLNSQEPEAVPHLRHEVMAYLRRHAEPGGDLDAAELLFSEAVGNAVRHAGGPVWVSLSWLEAEPTLAVYDLGAGFDPRLLEIAAHRPLIARPGSSGPGGSPVATTSDIGDVAVGELAESGRGLFIISQLAPDLQARARAGEGMVVAIKLPLRKQATASHDPLRHRTGVLPSLEEARPEGGFGKETFLRALVVQLAQTMELQQGPDAAEAAVAQVGTDVGGQMEEEFRRAAQVVGRMSPEQMAACYVRLKHAIDGDFYVVEATQERIVLGNRRCPFGEVVKQAPSLCRMTSSVFGGIAARNTSEGASVLLEERIAVGDPGCRVVVYLDGTPAPVASNVHVYQAVD